MTTTSEVKIDDRPEVPYLGIRTKTPFKGMFKVVGELSKELSGWLRDHGVEPSGPPFLRYHIIDMAGVMDVEYGAPVRETPDGEGRISRGVLPAGRYASLVYVGHGMVGNRALLVWARDNGVALDKWEDAKGDGFRSRCEFYLTDPKLEPRKSKWEIEVAIKLADEAARARPDV